MSESYQKRLQRFQTNEPIEFIDTLILGIQNYFLPELKIAAETPLNNLVILGIVAVIETITEKIFLKRGKDGLKFYLQNFVDVKSTGGDFSTISTELNEWRNVLTHQFISKLGHSFSSDFTLKTGYTRTNNSLVINPKIFFEQFESAFFQNSQYQTNYKIFDYENLLNKPEMENAKNQFLKLFSQR